MRLSELSTGRRSRWLVIAAWILLAVAAAPFQPRLQEAASDENEAFLADSAESTRVDDLLDEQFTLGSEVNATVVYTRPGAPLTEEDYARIDRDARALCDSGAIPDLRTVVTTTGVACGELDAASNVAPETGPPNVSGDGSTALISVDTGNESTGAVVRNVATLRERLPGPGPGGLEAYVTGEAGFVADQSEAFEGIDQTLLAITLALVLVLLLATYRSPVVALVPLIVVAVAYLIAAGLVYALVRAAGLRATGQSTAILIVLMFGAGTDYCLLLVSRYREELAVAGDASGAIALAARRTGPAILSAGATVVVAMLVLVLADYRATSSMGPVLAVGVAVTVLAGLTLLPALLAVLGRRAFWPAVPVAGSPRPGDRGPWRRTADLVRARPGAVTAVALVVLVAGSLGNLASRGTLDLTEGYRDPPESVRGVEVIQAQFGPGRGAPLDLVVPVSASPYVLEALGGSGALTAVTPVSASRDGGLLLASLELAGDPFSDAAQDAVPRLRALARRAVEGRVLPEAVPPPLIGGATAEAYDAREAQAADARLIAPLTLGLVLLIVVALVRAVVAPLYLVGTVLLSYAFALGASSLVFTHVLGQPDSDPGLPLFAFIFLVALGVDYNLFVVSRIREERRQRPTRDAVREGLARTGGVITSAGLILAGTFAALLALPVQGLAQVGFTIALGVLVDTFLVRVFLVPGIATLLGERNWWPQRRVLRDC